MSIDRVLVSLPECLEVVFVLFGTTFYCQTNGLDLLQANPLRKRSLRVCVYTLFPFLFPSHFSCACVVSVCERGSMCFGLSVCTCVFVPV